MTLNRELFVEDPTQKDIPNLGVAKVGQPDDDSSWRVLRYELESFVCEGEYERGLDRILSTYLSHLDQDSQPTVWVSGFYGSGKSHLVRVLEHLWRDEEIPGANGATARGLVTVSQRVEDSLRELTAAGKRAGGLWSAAGT
ncbi:MAG: BREX system P-loop protein BrxC, partial [Actinomycetota bacterium]|nr:BREX system P-loop protein BrxC [Actinomycetota bacterium]